MYFTYRKKLNQMSNMLKFYLFVHLFFIYKTVFAVRISYIVPGYINGDPFQ